ncbi:CsbD family protein [Streptomyces sp. TP-A0874]|uniref:CsbD family protein n=1 Tax=Streptomyces sp. TP-A0874 TaxID=549819 RepID=UPI000853B4AF|nr:CsbD family protein [Streptomyces sp. TP-A0874]
MADDGAMDKIKGKAKEMVGKAKHDKQMSSEGDTDQMKGKAKEGMEEAKKRASGMKDSMKQEKGKGKDQQ